MGCGVNEVSRVITLVTVAQLKNQENWKNPSTYLKIKRFNIRSFALK